jgi:signal transduction histidine kinase
MPAKNPLGVGEVSEMVALICRWVVGPPVAENSQIVSRVLAPGARRGKESRPRTVTFAFLAACLLFQPKANSEVKEVRIALGPSPLRFMIDSHEKFFAGIPIVFGGTSGSQADNRKLNSHLTGCWEMFEPDKTLDVALRLQPASRHIVVVGGISSFDKHLEDVLRERFRPYEGSLDFADLTDLDMPSLLERLRHLSDHTIVLYTRIGMDAKATRYIGASQAGPMVAESSNAPVLGPSDADLGPGQVGGYLESFAMGGKIVGGIALRILNGESPQGIPAVRGANAHIFDESALRRWGFQESDLPRGSEVQFRGPSLWERTKSMWAALSLILLCLIVLGLCVRLKLAKDRALELSGMLITAQEKERSRLASEIHDDFSQRLALLALGLENAEDAIGASPEEAVRQVHDLLNSASEIGADLHTFSHRLHSSTLERLGLVPGVSALCKEFAIQYSVEVDFRANDVSRSIHPDASLCVFRIVQEGLRNLKKHSGAAKAQVQLRMSADRIVVTIRDEGAGFDVRELGNKEGIGIRSMEERAYSLGGRCKVYSEPGRGTEIEASVPLQPRFREAAG